MIVYHNAAQYVFLSFHTFLSCRCAYFQAL